MSERERLIEAMARAIDPAAWNTRVMESIPDYKGRQEVSKHRATAALTAIEAEAVIVPMLATAAMWKAAAEGLGVDYDGSARAKDRMGAAMLAFNDMLAASPYRRRE